MKFSHIALRAPDEFLKTWHVVLLMQKREQSWKDLTVIGQLRKNGI